jgi:hypothetical protein
MSAKLALMAAAVATGLQAYEPYTDIEKEPPYAVVVQNGGESPRATYKIILYGKKHIGFEDLFQRGNQIIELLRGGYDYQGKRYLFDTAWVRWEKDRSAPDMSGLIRKAFNIEGFMRP